jgi:hypothetical protein
MDNCDGIEKKAISGRRTHLLMTILRQKVKRWLSCHKRRLKMRREGIGIDVVKTRDIDALQERGDLKD